MGRFWTGNTRAPWHDYTQRQIYHITLKKHPDAPYFGRIAGDWRLPKGTYGHSYLQAYTLGLPAGTTLSRSHCLWMNALARTISCML